MGGGKGTIEKAIEQMTRLIASTPATDTLKCTFKHFI
jgi:hypothetical protein